MKHGRKFTIPAANESKEIPMSPSLALLLAFLIGVVCGLRSPRPLP
jgi:hypothetical protein